MQEKTIINALLRVRRQAFGRDIETQHHAEALLQLRGVDLASFPLTQRATVSRFPNGVMRRMLLDLLNDGPKPMRALAETVHAAKPEITYNAAYKRTSTVLDRLRVGGRVVRREGVWRLAH